MYDSTHQEKVAYLLTARKNGIAQDCAPGNPYPIHILVIPFHIFLLLPKIKHRGGGQRQFFWIEPKKKSRYFISENRWSFSMA